MRAAAVGDSTSIRARAMEAAIAWADAEDWNPALDDGARLAEDTHRVFGVTTFEFG